MNELAHLVDGVVWWHWLLLAMLLLLAELAAPGEVFIWIGAAAGVVGLTTLVWADMPWVWQFVQFAVLSVLALFLLRGWFARRPITTDAPNLNRRGERYVGRVLTLSDSIENGFGSARIGDTRWRVAGPSLPAGATVRVTGVSGSTLDVVPADNP